MNYHKLTKLDIETEENLLAKYKEEIKSLPKGKMVCCKSRDKQSYYLAVDGSRKYLNSKDSKLVDGAIDVLAIKLVADALRTLHDI